MRRTVQSCVEISLFPLDESGSPSAVNAGSREEFRQFDVKRGFATQEDAELGGLNIRKEVDR